MVILSDLFHAQFNFSLVFDKLANNPELQGQGQIVKFCLILAD